MENPDKIQSLKQCPMNNPLISIVVCTYNRVQMLERTMESIFAQQYRPVEILIIDDGSTDNTGELIEGYGNKVRYHRQENKGIAAARTIGCKLAEGEYIAFQDDDDLMPPNRIICLYKALCRYPDAVLAVGDWVYIDAEGNSTGKRSKFNIHAENGEPTLIEDGYKAVLWPFVTPLPHTTLFKRADGECIGWFDDARFFHGCSDTDFFACLGQLGPIVYVPEIVSYYRMGHNQLWANNFLGEYSRFLLLEKHLNAITSDRNDLKKRLQFRMLNVLKQIASLQKNGDRPSHSVPGDYLKRGLSLLDLTGKLKYQWYASVRLPVRRFVLGQS
ncbi:MAG: glycosyltransferase family 2 protein [Nitrospirae bacterium]|nr:glycosyltransferase family 2 protein [Nitrospirota bacterium]